MFLIPVCEDGLIFRNDEYGWLFTSGNVGTLRLPIARNRTLMNGLKAQGYDEQDVISLRFGGGTAWSSMCTSARCAEPQHPARNMNGF